MKHRDDNNILQNEYAFRYLFPSEDLQSCWSLDEWESTVAYQASEGSRDIVCEVFDTTVDNLLCHKFQAEGMLEQLCIFVFLLSANMSVTPNMSFLRHRTYPSPRSYYPFVSQFYFGGALYEFNDHSMSIKKVGEHPTGTGLILKPRFDQYAAMYNLFRKNLIALELGHLTKQAYELASILGLRIANQSASQLLTFDIDAVGEVQNTLLEKFISQSRTRNSGEYAWGIYPKYACLKLDIDTLLLHWHKALSEVSSLLGLKFVDEMAMYVWRNTRDGKTKIYRLARHGYDLVKRGEDIAEQLQHTFSYDNATFSTLSSCLYFAVPYRYLSEKGTDAQRVVQCLGYLSQYFINLFAEQGLFSRPFKSFIQHELDSFLEVGQYHEIAGYGLISGQNRAVSHRAYLL